MIRGNFNNTGGQQVNWDDFAILQDQLYKAIELQYLGSGAFINQGCLVTGAPGNYSISSGLVYIDGKIMQFNAVTGVTSFPKYIHQATPANQDSFALEQGGSAYKRTRYFAELVNTAPVSGEYITVTASGGRNYNDVLANQFVRLSGNQTINGSKTFTSTINGTATSVVDNAITGPKLAFSAVTTTKIADGSVISAKIADGAVSAAKTSRTVAKSQSYDMPTVDVDDIVENGIYQVDNAVNANCPALGKFIVMHLRDSLANGTGHQIAFQISGANKGDIYGRDLTLVGFTPTWSSWLLINDASA